MATRHEEAKHENVNPHAAEPQPEEKKEPPKPEHPMRSALVAAYRNSGMTADQAEGVVKAHEDYLVAGTSKH